MREEVRDAAQIGERPVAVEPDERQELAGDLQIDEQHDEEEELPPRDQEGADAAERKDQVKIETPEVGADSGPATEPVAVGRIGVERRIDEVEPNPHPAHLTAAVA